VQLRKDRVQVRRGDGIDRLQQVRPLGQSAGIESIRGALEMPEIHVYCAAGRTPEQKKDLMKGLTDAMVKSFSVPAEAVTVQIVESPKTDKAKGGVPFTER
jgi:4-oxalocrotonate tautomerase